MELPIEFLEHARLLENQEDWKNGAHSMINAVEAMLNNMLQDLYTPEEKEGIKDVLKYLHTVKPLNTEIKWK